MADGDGAEPAVHRTAGFVLSAAAQLSLGRAIAPLAATASTAELRTITSPRRWSSPVFTNDVCEEDKGSLSTSLLGINLASEHIGWP